MSANTKVAISIGFPGGGGQYFFDPQIVLNAAKGNFSLKKSTTQYVGHRCIKIMIINESGF